MHPRPTTRVEAGQACSSVVREGESGVGGASAMQGSDTIDLSIAPAGRGEGGGDKGAFELDAGGKLVGGEIGMNTNDSSSAHLPHYKLVQLL